MDKVLASIRREKVDSNKIQGFVLDESDKLLLLRYVYDFNLDGILVLSKEEITELKSTDTDKFQTDMLREEGVLDKVETDIKYDLMNWKAFIESAVKRHEFFIFEEEKADPAEFTIGKIMGISEDSFEMKYFTGVARWLDEIETLYYSGLTSCQIGTSYLNHYERYFKRQNA